jgi:hypothetical protein
MDIYILPHFRGFGDSRARLSWPDFRQENQPLASFLN